jgi:FkbM family methyltransferase
MSAPDFRHEYDLDSLVLIRPKGRDFSMYVTPRYRQHYAELPFEESSADLVTRLMARARLFIDVGAHYGFYALLAGKSESRPEVIACEPTPETCKVLAMNVALNHLANVAVEQVAMSDQDGTSTFNISISSDSCGFHANPEAQPVNRVEVKTQRLDSLLATRPPCPVLIKIDTEGHELAVLQGLSASLERFTDIQLLVEFNPMMQKAAGRDEGALLSWLQSSQYTVFHLDEASRAMTRIEGQEQLSLLVGPAGYTNLYCLRTGRAAPADAKASALHHHIEQPVQWKLRDREVLVQGWCFGDQDVIVQGVRALRGKHVWNARYGLARAEIGGAHPNEPLASRSGFQVGIKVPIMPARLHLEAQDQFGRWHQFHSRFTFAWRRLLKTPSNVSRPKVRKALPGIFASLRFNSYVLAVSHSDYRIAVGGTQKQMQQEEELLAGCRISFLEVHPAPVEPPAPTDPRDFLMGFYVDSHYAGAFTVKQLRKILRALTRRGAQMRVVHLHHLMGFNLEVVSALLQGLDAPKTVFLHDFYTVCRQLNLLQNDCQFCGGPPIGSPICADCSYGEQRPAHFAAFRRVLDAWQPDFVVPSKVAADIWSASYPDFRPKVRVIPHLVAKPAVAGAAPRPAGARLRIAYVGYEHPNKGWAEWKQLASRLPREHYEVYVLGNCNEVLPEVRYIPVSFVQEGNMAMVHALQREKIDLAFLWSLVPETYSFTLFESMAAGCFILTNPLSGNIAAQVAESGRGLVAENLDDAIKFLKDAAQVRARLAEFSQKHPPFDLAPNPALADELAGAKAVAAGKES